MGRTPSYPFRNISSQERSNRGSLGVPEIWKKNFDGTKVVHVSDDIFLCVDRDRIVYFYNLAQDDGYETPIPNNVISRSVYGLQNIQGTVYAVGQPRAVARRDGPNQWTLISQEAQQGADTVLLPGDTPSS